MCFALTVAMAETEPRIDLANAVYALSRGVTATEAGAAIRSRDLSQ